ncbi:uncharacterized protein GWK60_G06985 [Nakaseomyces glabratus]|nr:hypothetical protein J6894_01927 [Nakaseomyces glabratus]QNG14010.1 uncharacterized protein GWK60_G06985 [Nakaseomyces glabratus]
MDLLVGKPWKLRVYHGDRSLNVNVFPETKVSRLVQYLHLVLGAVEPVEPVDECGLKYKDTVLPLYFSLKEALRTYSYADASLDVPSFIRLEFVHTLERGGYAHRSGEDIKLAYSPEYFGKFVTVGLEVNTLSLDKIATTIVERVDLKQMGIMNVLAEEVVKKLVRYEEDEDKNLCGLMEKHSTHNLLAFLIKGNHIPFKFLHDLDPHCYDSLTLLDLLGVDILPSDAAKITIMFNCAHEQRQLKNNEDETEEEDEGDTLEFISDSVLSIRSMKFDENTTVRDVKEFVCSVYTHTLSLSVEDIKLVYKGNLLKENGSKIMSCIEYGSEASGTYKLHVQINQEFNEPAGPGFWSELFSNPNLFDYVQSSTRLNTPALTRTPTSENLATPSLQRLNSNLRSVSPFEAMAKEPELEFFDEEGRKLVPLEGELYWKCLLVEEDKEVFVNCKYLNERDVKLEIDGKEFEMSSFDYDYDNNSKELVNLSKDFIARLEKSLGIKIKKNSITVGRDVSAISSSNIELGHENVNSVGQRVRRQNRDDRASRTSVRPDTFKQRMVRYFGKFIGLGLLVFRTLYLVGYNALIPVFILYEFSPLVPSKYSYLIVLLLVARAVWNTHEIWVMWAAYLHLNGVNEEQLKAIEEHVEMRRVSRQYFSSVGVKGWDHLEKSVKRLIIEPAELQSIRQELYTTAGLISESNSESRQETEVQEENADGQGEVVPPVIPVEEQLKYMREIFIRLSKDESEANVELLEKIYVLLNATLERYKARRTRLVRNPPLKKMWDDLLVLLWRDVKHVNPSPSFTTTVVDKVGRIIDFVEHQQVLDTCLEHVVPNPSRDSVFVAIPKNLVLFILLFFPYVKEKTLSILQRREQLVQRPQAPQAPQAPQVPQPSQEEQPHHPEEHPASHTADQQEQQQGQPQGHEEHTVVDTADQHNHEEHTVVDTADQHDHEEQEQFREEE